MKWQRDSGCAESRVTNRTGPCRCSTRKETCTCCTAPRCRRRSFRAAPGCPPRIYRTKKCKTCWPTSLAARSCREARIETPAVCRAGLPLAAQVSDEDLRKEPESELAHLHGRLLGAPPQPAHGDQSAHHLAPRAEMGAAIPGTGDLETVPLVYQGVMYATIPNEVFALDAITGREIWHYRAPGGRARRVNRGVAMLGDRVYFATADCHLVALRRTSGAVVWDREYAAAGSHYSCTAAPLAVKDKIVVGVASSGQTCFIAALSAETGNEAWRVWTVPRKGEPGSDTWGNFPLENGSAPAWTTGTYDPDLNLLYWPTGNPWPDFGGDRPGDNLYSDCVLALDPDTGKMKWYFQFVPHDTHDWDANEAPVLLDTEFRGRPTETPGPGKSKRILLHSGSHQRRVSPGRAIREGAQLGDRHRRQRPPDRGAEHGSFARRRASLSHGAWRH